MEAIQGVGGVNAQIRRSPAATPPRNNSQQETGRSTLHEAMQAGAALDLSKLYLSSALHDSGFVDLCAGVQMACSPKEAVDSFVKDAEKSRVDRIMDMVLPPDTHRVARLLW